MRPNFLIIGASKCGTSTLCEHLRRHPQVFMTSPKEPHFFSDDTVFVHGWAWYEALFSGAHGKLAIGEGTTTNTMLRCFPNASQRIATHLPNTKLIYIVRNPLDRIESHWRMMLGFSDDGLSFDEFLRGWPDAVDISCYWRQISAYRSLFPDDRILVLFFEEFVKDPEAGLKRCFEFLGVDPSLGCSDPSLAVNVSKEKIDGQIIRFVRRLPGVKSAKRAMPAISKIIGGKLRRRMPDPLWPAHLRRHVIDQLADDTASFLRHYQKPPDLWPFVRTERRVT